MIDADEIVRRYRQRRAELEPVNSKRRDVRDAYNGELRVALPDIGRTERSAVANLLQSGTEGMAQRASSMMPSVFCPPRDPSKKTEVKAAEVRRKALAGWWEKNDLDAVLCWRFRHLIAYAASPMLLWPDLRNGLPVWQPQHAMSTFAAPSSDPLCITPADVIFSSTRTYSEIKAQYPDTFTRLRRRETPTAESRFTVLRFVDDAELVTVCIGDFAEDAWPVGATYAPNGFTGGSRYEVLDRLENRAGVCLAVTPGRITLDKALGQFDGILGMYAMAARLMALEVIATEKGVFPDTYLVSRPGEQAKFLTGEPKDGRTGLINIIAGGDIKELGTAPGFQTNPTIDRLERAMRLTGNIPAEMNGESGSNIRTARRGEQVLSAAVDFPVQEQQKVMARSLREENRRAIAVAKGWFGPRQMSFHVTAKGSKGLVDFTPDEAFTTDANVVAYAFPGSDQNGLTIMLGQKTGMGVMSKRTAQEMDPMIDDPEQEHDRTIAEALEAALLASVQQKANAGEIAPGDLAWLMQEVSTNRLELADALVKLDERVSQRQATQAQPMTPEAMPGLAGGTPAEGQAAQPVIPEGPEAQQNLSSMLGALRLGQRMSPAERPAA